ncbi:ThuA domain-containing protein [Leifsonia poae]|uniref:ThuA domain-containing protein n=1 Tax=Leifsonia poae TaxID=110933 RepID=UPI001CBC08C7|nr:ThuA domain-containing protein [Leifsonia poae]
MIRATVWNEFVEEKIYPSVSSVYPDGIHVVLAQALGDELAQEVQVRTAVMQDDEHGLTDDVLAATDVLLWWSHLENDAVSDEIVARVQRRVHQGMGLLILHSAILSKVAKTLLGTSNDATGWRHGDKEHLWTILPTHPIAAGVPNPVVIPQQEMYGEPIDIPTPDELVFISNFEGGEVLRSGCAYLRGQGRIFFFAPGHEEYPVYFQPEIRRILGNAVRWAAAGLPAPARPTRTGEYPASGG